MAKKPNSGPDSGPSLVPQAHGGALLTGGVPGNKGGGRHKMEIRALFAGDALTARNRLIELIEQRKPCEKCGAKLDVKEVTLIFDKFAKYGVGTSPSELTPELMEDFAEAVRQRTAATDEQMQALWGDLQMILGRHTG